MAEMEKEKSAGQLLEEELMWKFPHIGKEAPEQNEEANAFCEGYKAFLNAGKTERECVLGALKLLKEAGYEELDEKKSYAPGDKVYYVNRKKAILMTTFGKRPVSDGVRINVAHIDSPRLDLSQIRFMRRATSLTLRLIITAESASTSGERLRLQCMVLLCRKMEKK